MKDFELPIDTESKCLELTFDKNSLWYTYYTNTFLASCKRGLISPNLAICYHLLSFYFKFSLWKVIIQTVSAVHVG